MGHLHLQERTKKRLDRFFYYLLRFQAKDTQIGVLKVRLAEADSELMAQNGNIVISFFHIIL